MKPFTSLEWLGAFASAARPLVVDLWPAHLWPWPRLIGGAESSLRYKGGRHHPTSGWKAAVFAPQAVRRSARSVGFTHRRQPAL